MSNETTLGRDLPASVWVLARSSQMRHPQRMCRLTAYLGPPVPLDRLVFGGTHSLHRQSWAPRELLSGSVNADGYGVAWWPAEGSRPVRVARSEPIWHDPDLPGLLAGLTGAPILAALRNATPGLPVDRSGLPPVLRDRWAFALNGYVPAFRARHMRRLRSHLPDALYARLEGVSDTETLFHLALAKMSEGGGPEGALRAVRDRVAEGLSARETAPLTMALAGPTGLWILHTTLNGADALGDPSASGVNSLYTISGSELAPEGCIVASERLTQESTWTRVPDHVQLHVSAAGEVSLESL